MDELDFGCSSNWILFQLDGLKVEEFSNSLARNVNSFLSIWIEKQIILQIDKLDFRRSLNWKLFQLNLLTFGCAFPIGLIKN